MYIQARIRKYVIGGADLPPPTLNRVKKHFVGSKSCVIGTAAQNTLYGRANHFLSERW